MTRIFSSTLFAIMLMVSTLCAQTTMIRPDRINLGGACVLRTGSGTPEGSVTGNVCDTYWRTDNGTIYTKTSGTGNTGWTLMGSGGSFSGFADGSSGSPGAYFSSQTGLGFYRPSSGNIGVTGHLLPSVTATHDLGSSSLRFRDLWGTTADIATTTSGALGTALEVGKFEVFDASSTAQTEYMFATTARVLNTGSNSRVWQSAINAVAGTNGGSSTYSLGMASVYAYMSLFGSATSPFAAAINAGVDWSATDSVPDVAVLKIDSPYAVSGTDPTTYSGIDIDDQTAAGVTNNYAIRYSAPSSKTFGVKANGDIQAAGVTYTFPAANAAGCLTNNGSGTLDWDDCGSGGSGITGMPGEAPWTDPTATYASLTTWDNQSSVTATVANSIVNFKTTGSTSGAHIRYGTAPATPWTFTARITPPISQNTVVGLCFRESATGKVSFFNMVNQALTYWYMSAATTWSSTNSLMTIQWSSVRWMRIGDDGTNLSYAISPDGYTWTQWTAPRGTHFTTAPDQLGICATSTESSGMNISYLSLAIQ